MHVDLIVGMVSTSPYDALAAGQQLVLPGEQGFPPIGSRPAQAGLPSAASVRPAEVIRARSLVTVSTYAPDELLIRIAALMGVHFKP